MHGFLTMGGFLPTGVTAMNEAIEHLRGALASTTSGSAVATGVSPSDA
jgi:hypothetical protein